MKKIIILAFGLMWINCMAQQLDPSELAKARQGNAESQNNVAIFYANKGDDAEALYWWQLSAASNYRKAQSNLGEFYCRKKEYQKALRWLRPAAEGGSTASAFRLALCYRDGLGVEKNISESLKWSLESAKGGNKDGYYLTADIYVRYYNDIENARPWFKRAASAGIPEALNWVGIEEMKAGNEDEGFRCFMSAAQKGHVGAQYNVGVYYYKSKQYEAAKTWLKKAAGRGYRQAIEMLESPQFK